jgi:hypothetical protein
MICPKCKDYKSSGKFCERCGTPLIDHRCGFCNNRLTSRQKFCEECGAKTAVGKEEKKDG